MEAIFGSTGLVLPGGITILILWPFIKWPHSLCTGGFFPWGGACSHWPAASRGWPVVSFCLVASSWPWATPCMSREVPDHNSHHVAATGTARGVSLIFLFTAGLSGVVSSTISASSCLRGCTSPEISKFGADITLAKNILQLESTLLTPGFHPWGILSVLKYKTCIDCSLVVMM